MKRSLPSLVSIGALALGLTVGVVACSETDTDPTSSGTDGGGIVTDTSQPDAGGDAGTSDTDTGGDSSSVDDSDTSEGESGE